MPKSDRRVIITLFGLIIVGIICSIYHTHFLSLSTYQQTESLAGISENDSVTYSKKKKNTDREYRHRLLTDSFAKLKKIKEERRQEREKKYLVLRDSFARLKAEREQRKVDRDAQWKKTKDSLDALRPKKLSLGESIELNDADSLQLIQIPGIGKGFAHAIIQYRNRLGGFYHVGQILEIKGIPEQVLNYIELTPHTQKMKINELSLLQLRKHPYLNFNQAKAIIEYRHKYGKIKDLSQLSLLSEFDEKSIEKLKHYVKF